MHKNSVISDYYGVKMSREFPVAQRINTETLRVDAFALYEEGAAEQLLEAFAEISA